jgi:hypothetical protein
MSSTQEIQQKEPKPGLFLYLGIFVVWKMPSSAKISKVTDDIQLTFYATYVKYVSRLQHTK